MNGLPTCREEAVALDLVDPLAEFAERFYKQPGQYYMDGNSLGLLSRDAEQALLDALAAWKAHGVEGWNRGSSPWLRLPETLGAMAAPLLGALAHECVVAGGTTINLHTLLATFFQPAGRRTCLLADSENFPSDLYALASHLRLHRLPPENLILIPPGATGWVEEDDIIARFDDDIAVAVLPAVWYKTGQLADMERLTRAAHAQGILIGFDCCHSIGAVAHELHDWGVDFAVWCNYKYLNAGPGATAGLYVHERHHQRLPGLAGWFGSDVQHQFDMAAVQSPAGTAAQWQIGTPPILSTLPVQASLRMFAAAGLPRLREKSLRQTEMLRHLLEQRVIGALGEGAVATPQAAARRGGHIAFQHHAAIQLSTALRANGVVPDFRPPDIVRLAPVALYTSYADIWDTVEIMRRILQTKSHLAYAAQADEVT